MGRKVLLCLLLGIALLSPMVVSPASCGEDARGKAGLDDRVIGSTVKLMAKAYVLAADVEKLKRKHIAQIREMDDDTFYASYANTLGVIAESPEICRSLAFVRPITREQVIERIAALDKKRLCGMVDAIPDAVIARRFKRFMARRMDEMRTMDPVKRIRYAWNSLVGRIER